MRRVTTHDMNERCREKVNLSWHNEIIVRTAVCIMKYSVDINISSVSKQQLIAVSVFWECWSPEL